MNFSHLAYTTLAAWMISWCSTLSYTPIQWNRTDNLPTPELAKISAISPEEMQKYGWIMTRNYIKGQKEKIAWICHYSKVRIPSNPEIRNKYKKETWKDWYTTWWDTYTVTARHCVDTSMWSVRNDNTVDVVAVRSLNRLWNSAGITFRSVDKPPVLERSDLDENTIGSTPLILRACVPHATKNTAHCFKIEGRTYSEWQYWQRYFFYKIAELIPFLEQAGRNCSNDASVSWTSGMIVTENDRAFAVVSNGIDICKASIKGSIHGVLWIETLRNSLYSLPWSIGKTEIIPN